MLSKKVLIIKDYIQYEFIYVTFSKPCRLTDQWLPGDKFEGEGSGKMVVSTNTKK